MKVLLVILLLLWSAAPARAERASVATAKAAVAAVVVSAQATVVAGKQTWAAIKAVPPAVPKALVLSGLATRESAAQQAAGLEAPVTVDGLVGIYLCDGTNPDGETYHAALEVAAHGEAYSLTWAMEPTGSANGFGVLNGVAFAVIYQMQAGIGFAGYVVERTGSALRLSGRWTMPGAQMVMRETCAKTAARTLKDVKGPRRGV